MLSTKSLKLNFSVLKRHMSKCFKAMEFVGTRTLRFRFIISSNCLHVLLIQTRSSSLKLVWVNPQSLLLHPHLASQCSSTMPEKQTRPSTFPKNLCFSGLEVSNSPDTHSIELQQAKPHSYNENKNINLSKWQQTFLWVKDKQFSSHLCALKGRDTACKFLKLSKTTARPAAATMQLASGLTQPSLLHWSVQNSIHLLSFTLKQSQEYALEKGHPYYAARTLALLFITSMLHLDKEEFICLTIRIFKDFFPQVL